MSLVRSLVVAASFIAASVLLLLPPPAGAQGVLEACEGEIEQLCSDVSPGNGRIIACMYAHEDHLSETCANTIADLGDILDYFFMTIGNAMAICSADIEKHCAGTEFGGGRILTCLNKSAGDLAPNCSAILAEFSDELANE
jgi:Cysteine rich repeat